MSTYTDRCFIFLVLILGLSLGITCHSQTDSLRYYFNQAISHQADRNHEAAVELLELTSIEHLPYSEHDSLNAQVWYRLGISYFRLRNRKAAIAFWGKGLELRKGFLPNNHIDIIRMHINIGNAYMMLNDFEHSTTSLHTALDLLHTQDTVDRDNLSRVYEPLGMIAMNKEDYQVSQDYLIQSYQLKKELYLDQPANLINITTRLIDVYNHLEDEDKLLEYTQLSLRYALLATQEDARYQYHIANAYSNLAIYYSKVDSTLQAIQYYEKSIAINAKLSGRDHLLATAYSNLIFQYSTLGQYERALQYAQKAKAIFESDSSFTVFLARTLIEEGDVYYALSDYKMAVDLYHQAVQLIVIGKKLKDIYENPNSEDLILGPRAYLMDALYKKSRCLYHLEKLTEAASASESLLSFLKQIRNQVSDRTSKKYLLKSSKKFYELGIDIQYALFLQSNNIIHIEKVLSLFDASKASILYDALYLNVLTTKDQDLKMLIEKEQSLYRRISEKEQSIWEAGPESYLVDAKDTIVQYRTRIEKIRDSILQFVSVNLPNQDHQKLYFLNDLQNNCRSNNSAIIQYFIGSGTSYVVYLDQENYHFNLIDQDNALAEKVDLYIQNLKDYNSSVDDYVASAHDLYNMIVAPLLINKDVDKLIFIPDDMLTYIPFESLVVDGGAKDGYKMLHYLLKDYVVSYAASLSVLELQKSRELTSDRAFFLGMSSNYSNAQKSGLPQLTYALEELQQIHEITGGDIYINEQATKQHFLDLKDRYQNIHLSLHGLVNKDEPARSYLQFSSSNNTGNHVGTDNGRLYASDIYNQSLNTNMIVLSACETGSGALAKGEGILSLAHAFAYAGTKSTVMSLWQISSEATASIMTHFYNGLKKSLPQDQALRAAKLKYTMDVKASELAHPFYWAALIQYGDSKATSFGDSRSWFFCMLCLPVLIFFIYWIIKIRSFASLK